MRKAIDCVINGETRRIAAVERRASVTQMVTLVRVCTDNLTAGGAVMKSTQDGA